jgi:hypothetical protein
LTTKGKPVSTLKAGLYTFTVHDNSARRGFSIQKVKSGAIDLTGVGYKGQVAHEDLNSTFDSAVDDAPRRVDAGRPAGEVDDEPLSARSGRGFCGREKMDDDPRAWQTSQRSLKRESSGSPQGLIETVRESSAHRLIVSLTHGQPLIAAQFGGETTRPATCACALNRTVFLADNFPL